MVASEETVGLTVVVSLAAGARAMAASSAAAVVAREMVAGEASCAAPVPRHADEL